MLGNTSRFHIQHVLTLCHGLEFKYQIFPFAIPFYPLSFDIKRYEISKNIPSSFISLVYCQGYFCCLKFRLDKITICSLFCMLRRISPKTLDELLHTRFLKFFHTNSHMHTNTTRYKSELYRGLYAL